MTIIGIFVCCASVAFLRQSGFGTDPFQCFCNGLNHIVPLDSGTMCMLFSAAMISVELFLNRHYIGIATDLICVLACLAMGYVPGVGTLISALFTGPLISFFNRTVSEPLRRGRQAAH